MAVRLFSGPQLGWLAVSAALLTLTAYEFTIGISGSQVIVFGPIVMAVVMNACTVVAALGFGRTRQLRSSWFLVATVLMALGAATIAWPEWGRDLGFILILALMLLGFPTSLAMFFLNGLVRDLSWYWNDIVGSTSLLGLAYLQAFVLLPLVFRWRAQSQPSSGPEG